MSQLSTSTLLEMLRYCRPAGSKSEEEFIKRYIDCVPGMSVDSYGNRWYVREGSNTLISVHTDTVHAFSGAQHIRYGKDGVVTLTRGSMSNCLGADDTAGVYAALRMIEAGVPVSFVFHRAEEVGGRGSQWVTDVYDDWVSETFNKCVALDRSGNGDVITSQWGTRCCSDKFALALADEIGMGHKMAKGTFTDSANYMHLVPECTNISIGYKDEHNSRESLDTVYLEALITRLCAVNWDGLPIVRCIVGNGGDVWGDGLLDIEWRDEVEDDTGSKEDDLWEDWDKVARM